MMLGEQARHTGDAGAVRQVIERRVALAQRDHGLIADLRKKFAKTPDAAEVNRVETQAPLLPCGFQLAGFGRGLFPVRVSDFEQITAIGAAEILSCIVTQMAAGDAAETMVRGTRFSRHIRRRSGGKRHGPDLFLSPEILVGLVDPIGAGRIEDVEVDGVC